MPTPVSELVQQVREEYGFDQTPETVLRWLNQAHRQMVVRSQLLVASVTIGETATGVTEFDVPANVVSLQSLSIGGFPQTRASYQDILNLRSSTVQLWNSESVGVFAPFHNAFGGLTLALYPEFDAGLEIQAIGPIRPGSLTLASSVATPEEYDEALLCGAAAKGFMRDDEQFGQAQALQQVFEAGCTELRRQVRQRVSSGVAQIKVQGVNG
jgi:hypothetical protein